MPDLDLEPHQYAERDPKTGTLVREIPPRRALLFMFVAIGVLVYIFISRDQLTSGTLFGITALFAAIAGVFFAQWLRDVH